MNEKQTKVMDELFSCIGSDYHEIYMDLTEYAISLGYNPIRNKTHDITIDFRKNKIKKTIMKMEVKEQKHDGLKYGERDIPGLRLRFFAAKE